MNEMTNVLITGEFRKQTATANFVRRKGMRGWLLWVTVGGKTSRHRLGYSDKPCWTIACKFMDDLCPSKRKSPARKANDEAEESADILSFANAGRMKSACNNAG